MLDNVDYREIYEPNVCYLSLFALKDNNDDIEVYLRIYKNDCVEKLHIGSFCSMTNIFTSHYTTIDLEGDI